MHTEIEVSTLGQLSIQQNGQVWVDFISVKAQLLFVYLAMHPGEHNRKKLAGMLWSETNDQQALKNLRTVLSSIRQHLPDALIVARDGLAINPVVMTRVDASLFEQGCVDLLAMPNTLNTPDALVHMQHLAELYQGAFLADVAYRDAAAFDEWVTDKQRHLQELYARLLYQIVELAQKKADYDTALQYVHRLIALDPYWDAARRQLMRLLAYNNRSNDALLAYENFARLLADELEAQPEEETTTLYEQIRSRHLRPPKERSVRATQALIVLPDMPFVEAVDDIGIAQRMLNTPQCRLLTIYGISGVGKTALATQIAFQRQHLYRDGAHFIALKGTQSARDLPYIIANTLGIDFVNQTTPSDLEDLLLEYLKKHHGLLVLDNYDHLLPEIDFVQKILEQSASTQFVITSQAPLNLFREWLLPLQGLQVPSLDDDHPETYESVRLFELTAQRINPRFNLHENVRGVVEICQLVDGLPLALIIAAGWTQIIPINKIKEYIIEGQEFNLPLQQDLPPHHQSLEMMLEYTWNTLEAPEQYALMAMSIFNMNFDFDEAEQICGVSLGTLMTMIHKSLIQKYDEKYRMHQLIWRYARKKLLYSDKKEALGRQYMAYIVQLLQELQQEKLPLHEYLLEIEARYASIWNYDWMPRSFQPVYILNLARFLMPYWEIYRSDEMEMLHTLLISIRAADLPVEVRTLLHLQLARFYLRGGQHDQTHQYLQMIFQEDVTQTTWADWGAVLNLCLLHIARIDAEHDEDKIILSQSYLKLYTLYLDMRDYASAEDFFLFLLQAVSRPVEQALILAIQGTISAETDQFLTALNYFKQALGYLQQVDEPALAAVLGGLTARVEPSMNDIATY